jgi:hypothetical protein
VVSDAARERLIFPPMTGVGGLVEMGFHDRYDCGIFCG